MCRKLCQWISATFGAGRPPNDHTEVDTSRRAAAAAHVHDHTEKDSNDTDDDDESSEERQKKPREETVQNQFHVFDVESRVTALALSQTEAYFVTASCSSLSLQEATVTLWSLQTGEILSQETNTDPHKDTVSSVTFIDDHVFVTASHDGTAKIWRVTRTHNAEEHHLSVVGTCQQHDGPVTFVDSMNPRLKTFITGSHDATVKLWDPNTHPPTCLQTFAHEDHPVTAVSKLDDHHFVSIDSIHTVRVWKYTTTTANPKHDKDKEPPLEMFQLLDPSDPGRGGPCDGQSTLVGLTPTRFVVSISPNDYQGFAFVCRTMENGGVEVQETSELAEAILSLARIRDNEFVAGTNNGLLHVYTTDEEGHVGVTGFADGEGVVAMVPRFYGATFGILAASGSTVRLWSVSSTSNQGDIDLASDDDDSMSQGEI